MSVNEAGLLIFTNVTSSLWVQAVDCFKCDLLKLTEVNNRTFVKFGTESKWNITLHSENNNSLCEFTDITFEEHGIYYLTYNDSSCHSISVHVPPLNPYIPIYVIVTSFLVCTLLWRIIKYAHVSWESTQSLSTAFEIENDLGSPADLVSLIRPRILPSDESQNRRIRSLDVFRGITISLMIFVNYGGGEYCFMQHSSWNGITIADIVFPWFTWIMGVSIAIKIKSELRNSVNRIILIKKCSCRSFSLLLLGFVITNLQKDDLNTVRIPGVLQRLGFSYFIVSILEILFMTPQPVLQNAQYKYIEDLLESWRQWVLIVFIVTIHTCITFFLPVSNCSTGYLGAGGLWDHSNQYNCTGGAAGYLDRLVFTNEHIYPRPTCQKLYKCNVPYDPEGLLGTLTTVLCVYLGVHAGRIVQVYKKTNERVIRWTIWFLLTVIAAGLLCKFSVNDGFIPLNKNMWSLSYVLFCSGLAFLIFSVLHIIVDKNKCWRGVPFYQVGMNSIALYIGHVIFKQTFPWQWKPFFPKTHTEYFIMDCWATMLWIMISMFLYKRKIFITI